MRERNNQEKGILWLLPSEQNNHPKKSNLQVVLNRFEQPNIHRYKKILLIGFTINVFEWFFEEFSWKMKIEGKMNSLFDFCNTITNYLSIRTTFNQIKSFNQNNKERGAHLRKWIKMRWAIVCVFSMCLICLVCA
jgi:ABC-type phosphate/phosphonate transport system permease subunit